MIKTLRYILCLWDCTPCYPTLPWEIRMPRSVSKPNEGPWPVWPNRPSKSNIGIQGQKSSEMWCSRSSLFLSAMMGISCRWLYSMGTYIKPCSHSACIWRSKRKSLYCHLLKALNSKHTTLSQLLVQGWAQYLCRQFPSVGRFASGPGKRVRRTTGDLVDFLSLKSSHQPWPLDGISCPVSKLALVIITPCVHLSCDQTQ